MVVHSLLVVLMLTLVVVDMVVSGHVDATLAAGHSMAAAPLLRLVGDDQGGGDAVGGDGGGAAAGGTAAEGGEQMDPKAAAEKAARKAEKARLKPPKATRAAMVRRFVCVRLCVWGGRASGDLRCGIIACIAVLMRGEDPQPTRRIGGVSSRTPA